MSRRALTGSLLLALFVLLVWASGPAPAWRTFWPASVDTDEDARAIPGGDEEDEGDEDNGIKKVRYDKPEEFAAYHALIREPDLVAGALVPKGASYETGYQTRALDAALRTAKGGAALPWQEHGPSNVAGRARAFVVDRRDATGATWVLGTAGGGVWKTTDSGLSWSNTSGTMPNLSVSGLGQAASQPTTWYAGTGEGFGNVDAILGSGVFKLTDGGTTWTLLPSTATPAFRALTRLVVSPTDPNVVIATTTAGLYRTADGGATWTQMRAGRYDQVVASEDFSAVYASQRGACASTPPTIVRSGDGGATWTLVQTGFGPGMRTELAIDPANPQRLVAGVDACDGLSHLYLTTTGGDAWARVSGSTTGNDWLGGQGWYDNTIAISPLNPNLVLVGGIDVWRLALTPGAAPSMTASRVSLWNANTTSSAYAHADHHSLTFFQIGGITRLVSTDDGGVFSSDDAALVVPNLNPTWRARNGAGVAGLNTTQYYGVDKQPGAMAFLGGTQDNGTWGSPVSPTASSAWSRVAGGDGFDAAFNTASEFIVSLYYNQLYRREASGFVAVSGLDVGDNVGPFITTIGASVADRERLVVPGISGPWRSDDFGRTWSVGRLPTGTLWGFNGSRTPVAISTADARVVWAGTRMSANGRLFVSRDGGASYDATTNAPGISALITGLATHPTDPATAFALFSTANATKVLRTTDYGTMWTALSGTFAAGAPLSSNGFPNVAVYSMLAMPYNPNVLWAGTEIGLFVSENGGATWAKDNSGLPPVAIWQMRIADRRVVLATHGRGIWSVALPELSAYTAPATVRSPNLRSIASSPTGGVMIAGTVRDALDSLVIRVDGQVVERRGATAAGTVLGSTLSLTLSGPTTVAAQIVGYRNGQAYASSVRSTLALPARAAVESFAIAFEDASANAANLLASGFSFSGAGSFASPLAQTAHPYPDNATLTLVLTQPIRIGATSVLRYRDIAIVEPGQPNSTWPSPDFYDYVVVEGTKDGSTWLPVAPGYDARANAGWLAAYNASQPGTSALFVEQTVDLKRTFAAGDVVLLRFRLYTDADTGGWGWGIDDVRVEGTSTSAAGEARSLALGLSAPAPNPVRTRAALTVTLGERAPVRVDVYDVAGRRVATLLDETREAGAHAVSFDASGLGSGVYLVRMTAQGQTRTRAVSVVR